MNLRDRRSQTGACEVFCRKIDLILRLLYRSHRSADVLRRAREPERRIAIRRADLQHPARKRGSDQDSEELTGVARNIEHLTRPLGGFPVLVAPELLELGQQIF